MHTLHFFILLIYFFTCFGKDNYYLPQHFKQLYSSLLQSERDVIKGIKKKYPKIRQKEWVSYNKLGDKALNVIKLSDESLVDREKKFSVCDDLDQFSFEPFTPQRIDDFLITYAKCSLVQSDIDPAKVPIVKYGSNDLDQSERANHDVTGIYFKDPRLLIDFYATKDTKKDDLLYAPALYIGKISYSSYEDIQFQLLMIDKAVESLARSFAVKGIILKHLVLSYYGVEPLFKNKLLKSWGKNDLYYGDSQEHLYEMFDEHSLIVALMKNPDLIDYAAQKIQYHNKHSKRIKRIIQFLYKIKKIVDSHKI